MRFSVVAVLSAIASLAVAAPIERRATFVAQSYPQFQISGGVAGNALAEANKVFVDPFKGVDLATLSSSTVSALNTMREAAEDAETSQFNPQIDAASGAAKKALQVGKIKNKVLKLAGEVQVINIKIAQAKKAGKSTASLETDLATETTKLNNNVATDKKSAGQASKAVA